MRKKGRREVFVEEGRKDERRRKEDENEKEGEKRDCEK